MLGHHHLTTPCPPSVSEHFIPGLFGKRLSPAARIMAEELTGFKRNHNRMSQDGKICNGSLIPAVDSITYASAIRTYIHHEEGYSGRIHDTYAYLRTLPVQQTGHLVNKGTKDQLSQMVTLGIAVKM